MRTLEFPLVLDGAGNISTATLSRRMMLGVPVTYSLNVQNNAPAAGKTTLTMPAGEELEACPGVWVLRLCSPCGAWTMQLSGGQQLAPFTPGEYSGDGGAEPVVPSC